MNKKIEKNEQIFDIPDNLTGGSFDFFINRYARWETSSFIVYDIFSDKHKIFIDIGSWNGCTAIYAARLNKHVISVEPDPVSVDDYQKLMISNKVENVTLIENPVYSNSEEVNFSPKEREWNSSSSQIKTEANSNSKLIKAVTLDEVLLKTKELGIDKIDASSLSLIKIDIEGGEQHLFNSLLKIPHSIPLYISMHLDWWNNQGSIDEWGILFKNYRYIFASNSYGRDGNNTDFVLLPEGMVITYIKSNPFTSLVLSQKSMKKFALNNIYFFNTKKIDELKRALVEIKKPTSFRIGNLFFRSAKKPMKWITFPINLVSILFEHNKK